MNELILQFAVKGQPAQCSRYGCGHINETYLVTCDSGLTYILQKINKNIFTKPEELMENIAATTAFLAEHSEDPRASMHLVLTTEGKTFYKDAQGEYWRMYDFVTSTVCMQKAETPKDFYWSGLAFGRFQGQLAEFPAQTLHEAILGEKMDKRNFRKRVGEMNFIEKTDLVDKTSSRRGAFLYRFNSSEYKRNPEFKL